MPHHPHRERVLALAAMLQTAHLVRGIARKGVADAGEIRHCLSGILSADDAGKQMLQPTSLRSGLIFLQDILRGNAMRTDARDARELLAYCAGMMTIEKKLSRNRHMLQQLADGIERIRRQRDYFGDIMHENVIAAIAGLYGETVSTLKPRIIVHGKPHHLGQPRNTQTVRALLLGGIRAAHLWRVHGGGKLQLLLRRRALAREAERIIHESEQS